MRTLLLAIGIVAALASGVCAEGLRAATEEVSVEPTDAEDIAAEEIAADETPAIDAEGKALVDDGIGTGEAKKADQVMDIAEKEAQAPGKKAKPAPMPAAHSDKPKDHPAH